MTFLYEGQLARVRALPGFPSHAIPNLHPEAEWAAQVLLISSYFAVLPESGCMSEGDWMRCADEDSNPQHPDIYIEQVVGGKGPITLKSARSKDIIQGTLLFSEDFSYDYHYEELNPVQLVYACEDIFTKQVKGKPYLRRHCHIEKGGRLLWNMQKSSFVELIPNNSTTVGEAVNISQLCERQTVCL